MNELHVSRLWSGGDKEWFSECVCVEAPCKYVVPCDQCSQHGLLGNKTLRGAHFAAACASEAVTNEAKS